MANETKGGKRLAKNKPAQPIQPTVASETPIDYSSYVPAHSTDDAVIDEILRSISGSEPVVPAPVQVPAEAALQVPEAATVKIPDVASVQMPAAAPAQQTPPQQPQMNEYQEAASHIAQQQAVAADPYGMRDPSQTQSFRPARPAHRDTDRLPTIVDDQPKKKHPILNRILTLIVVVLILAALVLGGRMVYILGPSLGWNLPDLSNVPVVSKVLGLIPSAEEQPIEMPEEVKNEAEQEAVKVPDPTEVTLDAGELVLHEGEKRVLTATLDVENWDGLLAWASSDRDEQVIRLTVLGPNTAQVEYVGEGNCAVAVQVGVKPEDGSPAPHATCAITCEAPEQAEESAQEEQTQGTDAATGEHVDISLNREDFTLKVGERHQLMGDNADKVTWTSSNEDAATVSNGIVTAVAAGNSTITATGPDGTTASAICRVKEP